MQENQVPSLEEWVDSDQNLNEKTTELFESDLSVEEQAREALTYLIKNYNLPEMPLDLEDREGVRRSGRELLLRLPDPVQPLCRHMCRRRERGPRRRLRNCLPPTAEGRRGLPLADRSRRDDAWERRGEEAARGAATGSGLRPRSLPRDDCHPVQHPIPEAVPIACPGPQGTLRCEPLDLGGPLQVPLP